MSIKKIYPKRSDKELLKIINETISEFDFLGMDSIKEQENFTSLVNSKEFQIKLVNDLATWDQSKILDWKSDISHSNKSDLDYDDRDKLDFDYGGDFNYLYNSRKIPMSIYVEGKNISFDTQGQRTGGNHYNPPEWPDVTKVYFEEADITLFTGDGEEVDISWIDTNPRLKEKVVGNIVGDLS